MELSDLAVSLPETRPLTNTRSPRFVGNHSLTEREYTCEATGSGRPRPSGVSFGLVSPPMLRLQQHDQEPRRQGVAQFGEHRAVDLELYL